LGLLGPVFDLEHIVFYSIAEPIGVAQRVLGCLLTELVQRAGRETYPMVDYTFCDEGDSGYNPFSRLQLFRQVACSLKEVVWEGDWNRNGKFSVIIPANSRRTIERRPRL